MTIVKGLSIESGRYYRSLATRPYDVYIVELETKKEQTGYLFWKKSTNVIYARVISIEPKSKLSAGENYVIVPASFEFIDVTKEYRAI
jgi:hypothetical protein